MPPYNAFNVMRPIVTTLFILFVSLASASAAGFSAAKASAQADYDRSKEDLSKVQAEIGKEKEPLNRELAQLEDKLRQLQDQYAPLTREVDTAELNFSNLKSQVKLAGEENLYLTNILDEYTKGFESKVHASEMQIYKPTLDKAKMASENEKTPLKERFLTQVDLLRAAINRLNEIIGGARFSGKAVASPGLVMDGTFAVIGALAVCMTQRGGSRNQCLDRFLD